MKKVRKVGKSEGIIFGAAIKDRARVKVGDQLDVTMVPDSGAIMLMPIRKGPTPKEVSATIRKTIKDYRKTLRKLA